MIYKIGLLGATGKVGLEISELLAGDEDWQGDHFELGDAVGGTNSKLSRIEGVEVRRMDDHPREPVHAWIDFSRPEATLGLLERIDTPVVIGTTGFTEKERELIQAYSRRHPVLMSANTSPGMNLVFGFLKQLSSLPWLTDVVLTEEHHRQKKDSPSGTAKTLLGLLADKGMDKVQVCVTRAGSNKGFHSIRFISGEEEVEISHRVSDRKAFARGALWAAHFLLKKKIPGMYSMEEVYRT